MTLLQYARQEPSAQDVEKAKGWALRIVSQKTHVQIAGIIVELMKENMRLTAEVNDHRASRGFEPLPTHKP